MATYTVEWTIELEATSPQDAARQALGLQRDPTSTCTCFDVYADDPDEGDGYHHHKVDFTEVDGRHDIVISDESTKPRNEAAPRVATFSFAGMFQSDGAVR